MGLDLTIIPYVYGNEERMKSEKISIVGYSRLSFHRQYELFACFTDMGTEYAKPAIKTSKMSLPVYVYEDEGIKERTKDPYGSKLTYCLAGEFNKIDVAFEDYPYCQWNKAIIEMIKLLPSDTPIILYWH